MSMGQEIMWDILAEYGAALGGGALERANGPSTRSHAEAHPATPACAPPADRSPLGLLRNNVPRP